MSIFSPFLYHASLIRLFATCLIVSALLFLPQGSVLAADGSTISDRNIRQKVIKIRSDILDRKFAAITKFFEQTQQDLLLTVNGKPFDMEVLENLFLHHILRQEPAYLDRLSEWVKESDRSALSLIMRSQCLYDLAWVQRTTLRLSSMSSEQRDEFFELLSRSLSDAEEALQQQSDNLLGVYRLMQTLRVTGKARERIGKLYERGVEKQPEHLGLHLEMGLTLSPSWGGSPRATIEFARALAGNTPEGSVLPWVLVEAHRQLAVDFGDPSYLQDRVVQTEVASSANKVLAAFPRSGYFPRTLARMWWDAGFITMADQTYQLALHRSGSNWRTWLEAARFNSVQRKDKEAAVRLYTKVIELEPTLIQAYGERGKVYISAGKYERARGDILKVVADRPDDPRWRFELAKIFSRLKDFDAALWHLDKVLEEIGQPESAVLNQRCQAFVGLQRWELAISDCTAAIELNPQFPDPFWWRGKAQAGMGNDELAAKDIAKYKQLRRRSKQ